MALYDLLCDFPNLFFLHYSPSSVVLESVENVTHAGITPPSLEYGALVLGKADPFYRTAVANGPGTLFPRMIPVPHSLTQEKHIVDILAAAASQNTRGILNGSRASSPAVFS
eukprot:CAMPEP_0176420664 /NCGR_PEP_ID=MMETSP0127-20121128/8732_1 /TAXON_ID=938130 /ORGANISM="Platyophrya macrostoma, Strain WH" /LENGTH=111 /DNA_ID=CAMNT_0017801285 /DNA_START=6 /DNA_END=338 /DNA_ORIENTATION=+